MVSHSVSQVLSAAVSFCSSLPVGSRIAVVGSRGWPAPGLVREFVAALPSGVIVVSGAARGVDSAAASAARARGLAVEEFPYISHLNKAGGPVRNRQIVHSCAVVVGFSCGTNGTENALACAKVAGVPFFRVSPPTAPGSPIQASLF
jgi:hypothetical protein